MVSAWGIGTVEQDIHEAVVIVFPGKTRSNRGEYAEVQAELPSPRFEGRLILYAFVNDTMETTRWKNYRFLQLWVNEKMLWKEDIAAPRKGNEWVAVDLTEAATQAKSLKLRFRVWDRERVANYRTTVVLGPVRLVATGEKE